MSAEGLPEMVSVAMTWAAGSQGQSQRLSASAPQRHCARSTPRRDATATPRPWLLLAASRPPPTRHSLLRAPRQRTASVSVPLEPDERDVSVPGPRGPRPVRVAGPGSALPGAAPAAGDPGPAVGAPGRPAEGDVPPGHEPGPGRPGGPRAAAERAPPAAEGHADPAGGSPERHQVEVGLGVLAQHERPDAGPDAGSGADDRGPPRRVGDGVRGVHHAPREAGRLQGLGQVRYSLFGG